MRKRTYRKYTDIYAEFERFCREQISNHVFLVPPERTLTEQFAASRMTIRKVLAEAETNGLIRRDGHQTHILHARPLSACGRITYFVNGQEQIIMPPAFERLWLKLEPRLKSAAADFRLFQVNHRTSLEELKAAADESEVILLAIIDCEPFLRYLQSIQEHKCVVALSDPYLEQFRNAVALDNYAVGTAAADTLWDAGCRKAAVCGGFDHPIFNKRRQGFADRFQQCGGKILSYPFPPGEIVRKIPACAASLIDARERACDGIFILSDEWMDEITAPAYQLGGIPEQFKILSFNGSGDWMRCSPAVSVLNSGTAEVVDTLMRYLEGSAASGEFLPVRTLIKPHLYKNQTIG